MNNNIIPDMNASLLKKALPHLIAIAVFLLIAVVYCKPVLDGKVVNQLDITLYKGMAQQSEEFRKIHGYCPLWTESMFSGMPAYTIAMSARSPIEISYFYRILTLGLPKPISFFFLASICFYLLTQVMRINPWIGILSSIAYAYSTYDPILVVAGHDTKMVAIGYMPAIVAGLLIIFRRRYLTGAALFTAFVGLQTSTQHLQIIYYTIIIVAFITLAYFVYSWKQKQIKNVLVSLAIILAAGTIGFLNYALTMLPTREYASETTRGGKSELTNVDAKLKTKGGMDKDAAFGYSYGIWETFTLLVPGIYGGGHDGKMITGNSKFVDQMTGMGVPEDQAYGVANYYAYWGAQPGTSGAVYLGAVICFLFLAGLIYVKSWHKWWMLAVTMLGILMAWGKNFEAFNYFLFDHLPLYNKFRAPSVALVIPQLTFPLLGALGLDHLLSNKEDKELLWKKFRTTVLIMVGLLALPGAYYFTADFKSYKDASLKQDISADLVQQMAKGKQATPEMQQQANEQSNSIIKSLQSDRQSIFSADLIRTLLFVALAAALIGLYLKNKVKPFILLAGLAILSSYDLLAEGKKYLNEDKFVEPADFDAPFALTRADRQINNDPDKNIRVFDETSSAPFRDSRASYHHNSVGGYHAAPLSLYNDLIENQLADGNMMVYNMLNTKYFIRRNPADGQDEAVVNPDAFGPCWLVKSIHYVKNADEEMKALDSINVRDIAIIDKRFQHLIKFNPVADSSASIKLIENLNDKLNYSFSSKANQFAVFSEIYYDKGWNVFIDGNKADYCKVDYVLRGMPVPAGDHKIEFRFEPRSYDIGNTITVWAAIITFLLLIAAAVAAWKGKRV